MTRPFRFGVQLHSAPDAATWAQQARRAEELGYSSLLVPDHFGEQLAPVAALAAAAAVTTDLRIGALVWDNDYRHPVVLAKEAATLDLLSGGRLELGIGAGWMRSDYEKSGIAYDPPGVRIDRMVEGLAIVKGLLSGETVTFSGDHYQVTGMEPFPRPVQQPPPVIIGGGGRRVLSIAAREADIVGINVNLRAGEVGPDAGPNASAEATEEKVSWVREAAGERFGDLELNVVVFLTMVTDDRDGTLEAMAAGFGLTPEQARQVPHALVGSVDEICETLEERRDRFGFSYIVVNESGFEAMEPVIERLAGR